MSTLKNYFLFETLSTAQESSEDSPNADGVPEPRSGHRIVVTDNELYMIGGYNPDFWEYLNNNDTYYPLFKELWKFNLTTRKWKKLQTSGTFPVELASHSACLHGNCLFLFGGTGLPFGIAASNQVHVCGLKTLKWTHLTVEGDPPIPGYGSSINLVDNKLTVFGGTTGWQYNSNVHQLNITDLTWTKIEPILKKGLYGTPAPRYRHESAFLDNKLYIFGGGTSQLSFSLDQVPVFDLDSSVWDSIDCRPDPQHGFPSPRRCHTCVQFNKDVFVCGGYNGENIFGDLWRINLVDFRWQLVPASLPRPCYFHSAAITPSGCMYIYGGVIELDVERTSAVTAIQLFVPSLREVSWSAVVSYIPRIDTVAQSVLLEMGVPHDLTTRLK